MADDFVTQEEWDALIEGEHMVWCDGTHTTYNECVVETRVGDDAVIRIVGIPADNQYVELEDVLASVEEIDAAIAVLAQLRERFAAQQVRDAELEAICERVI